MGLALSLSHFAQLSWPALRYQAGRQLLALLAIVLGVALGFAVHLLNSTALAEFSSAATSLQGQPDVVLHSDAAQGLPEALLATLAADPDVQLASPILEGQALAQDVQDPQGKPFSLRVIGWDVLQGAALNPARSGLTLGRAGHCRRPSATRQAGSARPGGCALGDWRGPCALVGAAALA
jgi:putative ABC transport system permease protein